MQLELMMIEEPEIVGLVAEWRQEDKKMMMIMTMMRSMEVKYFYILRPFTFEQKLNLHVTSVCAAGVDDLTAQP